MNEDENSKWTNLIRLDDAIDWLRTMQNPYLCSILDDSGVAMFDQMVDDAVQALRKAADSNGLIVRSDAVRKINEALQDATDGMHPRNISAYGSIKAMLKEAMWYPAPVVEAFHG